MNRPVIIMSAREFKKAVGGKYISKKRGRDGKWIYKYGVQNPVGNLKGTASEKIVQAASIMSGTNLPESTYANVPEPMSVNAKERKVLNNAVNEALPGNYYKGIPIDLFQDALNKEGFVLIQEDGTRWSGMFLGAEGEAFMEMGRLKDGRTVNGMVTYKAVDNSGLRMTWYEMSSGKYEIVKYIT